MSKVIRISDSAFKRLQLYSEPLVDTPGTVIDKLLDFFESHQDRVVPVRTPATDPLDHREFEPESPPDLTHSRILEARIDGVELAKPNWNKLLHSAHIRAMREAENSIRLAELTVANVAIGRKEDEGYRYIPELELSIQGQDANDAWKCILHLAKQFNFTVGVIFRWRDKKEAAIPLGIGRLDWRSN